MDSRRHILHIITGIDFGGAEIMLCRSLEGAQRNVFKHSVICLRSRGDLAERIENAGGSLVCLGMKGPFSTLRGFVEMVRWIWIERPDLVQTWLAHGTLFGSLAALIARNRPLLWTIHTGNQSPDRISRPIRWINRALALFSPLVPRSIVSCSQSALEKANEMGYRRRKMQLIPNGTDTDVFRPDPEGGLALREELGIPPDAPVVGIVGRLTPEKDFNTFCEAALRMQKERKGTHFILCGAGVDLTWKDGVKYINRSMDPDAFHLLGSRTDMVALYSSFTILALTSVSEAFPLTVGEAMACGIPVVATDVGDCRDILADTGIIVPPGDAKRICRGWTEMLSLGTADYRNLSVAVRKRIEQFYSLERCIQRYEALYLDLCPREDVGPENGEATHETSQADPHPAN